MEIPLPEISIDPLEPPPKRDRTQKPEAKSLTPAFDPMVTGGRGSNGRQNSSGHRKPRLIDNPEARAKGIKPFYAPPPYLPIPIKTARRNAGLQDICRLYCHFGHGNLTDLGTQYGIAPQYVALVAREDDWEGFAAHILEKNQDQNQRSLALKKEFFEESDIRAEVAAQRENVPALNEERALVLRQMQAFEAKSSPKYRALLAAYNGLTSTIEKATGKDWFEKAQADQREAVLKLRAVSAMRSLQGPKEPGQDIEDERIIDMVEEGEMPPMFRPA